MDRDNEPGPGSVVRDGLDRTWQNTADLTGIAAFRLGAANWQIVNPATGEALGDVESWVRVHQWPPIRPIALYWETGLQHLPIPDGP